MVLRSLTKHWSIPGVRAGYLLGAAGVVADLRRGQVPWSVSTTAAAAIQACCTDEALAEAERRAHTITGWRTHLVAALTGLGIPHAALADVVPAGPAGPRRHGRTCASTASPYAAATPSPASTPAGRGSRSARPAPPTTSSAPCGPGPAPVPSPVPPQEDPCRHRVRSPRRTAPAPVPPPSGSPAWPSRPVRSGGWASWPCGSAASRARCRRRPLDDVRLVIFAGDHGVAAHGVSAYPPAITARDGAHVRGRARRRHRARRRPRRARCGCSTSASTTTSRACPPRSAPHKVRRGSGAIHLEDALTAEETQQALAVGPRAAARGDRRRRPAAAQRRHGHRQHHPRGGAGGRRARAAAPSEVAGRGTGVDDAGLDRKTAVLAQALARVGRARRPTPSRR